MRLWPRNTSGSERRAQRLVADYLGARRLAAPIRAAIERAVAEKLAWGTLPALDDAMRAAVDVYAQAETDCEADAGPATVAGVRWTDVGARHAAHSS